MQKGKKGKKKEIEPKRHMHAFEVTRAGFNDKQEITMLDFACTGCDLRLYVEGNFSWHKGFAQHILKVKDL